MYENRHRKGNEPPRLLMNGDVIATFKSDALCQRAALAMEFCSQVHADTLAEADKLWNRCIKGRGITAWSEFTTPEIAKEMLANPKRENDVNWRPIFPIEKYPEYYPPSEVEALEETK